MIRCSIKLLSTLSFPSVLLSSECPTRIFSASSPYMLRILAVPYWLNWSICDRRRLPPCIIFQIYFFRMKDSCISGHHPVVFAPFYSIYAEITTKLVNRHSHTQSKDAPCRVIGDIHTYSGGNCNITTTETRSFGNANGWYLSYPFIVFSCFPVFIFSFVFLLCAAALCSRALFNLCLLERTW